MAHRWLMYPQAGWCRRHKSTSDNLEVPPCKSDPVSRCLAEASLGQEGIKKYTRIASRLSNLDVIIARSEKPKKHSTDYSHGLKSLNALNKDRGTRTSERGIKVGRPTLSLQPRACQILVLHRPRCLRDTFQCSAKIKLWSRSISDMDHPRFYSPIVALSSARAL